MRWEREHEFPLSTFYFTQSARRHHCGFRSRFCPCPRSHIPSPRHRRRRHPLGSKNRSQSLRLHPFGRSPLVGGVSHSDHSLRWSTTPSKPGRRLAPQTPECARNLSNFGASRVGVLRRRMTGNVTSGRCLAVRSTTLSRGVRSTADDGPAPRLQSSVKTPP